MESIEAKETYEPLFQRQIRAGVNKLNKHFGGPENWVFKIDPSILDLSTGSTCVVGQVFNDRGASNFSFFITGLDEMRLHGNGARYGFNLAERRYKDKKGRYVSRGQAWSILTEEWIQEIKYIINNL